MVVSEIIPILSSTPKLVGRSDSCFESLTMNSSQVEPCSLFFAIKGSTSDGHQYIDDAVSRGASVVVCECLPENIVSSCTYLVVDNSHQAVGLIAHHYYGNPSSKLSVIGVTGTNGKTTIATLLYDLFKDLGQRCGLLSTINNRILDEKIAATHTTPDPISLNQLLAQMVEANCSYCFMEVSSHAIDQERIAGIQFKGGVFTNITRDHLDYHGTFDNYLRTKKRFFDQLPKNAFALSNADDKNGSVVLQNTKCPSYTYSTKNAADFRLKVIEKRIDGMLLELMKKEVWVSFTGEFNAQNILAVAYTAYLLEQDCDAILMGISKLNPVSGRMETFTSSDGVTAIVDFAHTPDALSKVLDLIGEVMGSKKQVITVVGAGGNRDKGKRPLMTKEALKKSVKVILTSDNPRNEKPADILKDMVEGLNNEQLRKILVIEDREQAIKTAYSLCKEGDLFLVAGKGHENYQEIDGVKHHFSDQETIKGMFSNN